MRTLQITSREAGQRLDRYLGKYMSRAPKSFFYKMLRKKNITLNGKKAEGGERLRAGDELKLFLSEETIAGFRGMPDRACAEGMRADGEDRNEQIPKQVSGAVPGFAIVFEDENILVVNKPVGMLSQKAYKSDVSLVEYITDYMMVEDQQESVFRPGICNRLDRNTTGLIVAGKNVGSLQYLNRLFRERDLEKYYVCLVKGRITECANIDGYLIKDQNHNRVRIVEGGGDGAVRIVTAYEPLDSTLWHGQEFTLLQVHLITGKPHQIRAHLQSTGHPIIGDAKYGEKSLYHLFKKEFGVRYQLLHAWRLCLGNPDYLPEQYRGATWGAPLPEKFSEVLAGIGIDGACLAGNGAG